MGMIPELFGTRFDLPDGGHLDLLLGDTVAEESILTVLDDVVIEGFTGSKVDTLGHKRQYVDGRQVKGQHDDTASPERASRTADAVGGGGGQLGGDRAGIVSRAVDRIKAFGSAALATKAGKILVAAEHRLGIVAHKTRDMAVEAAKRRRPPMDAAGVARLTRVLYVLDFAGSYVSGGIALSVAGPVAGKVAMFLPNVSVLYVAYATVRDPVAVWAGARAVVRATLSGAGPVHESAPPEVAGRLADLLGREDGDWREAVFLAAFAETGDANRAADLAERAPPMPDAAAFPTPTADDFGGEDAGE